MLIYSIENLENLINSNFFFTPKVKNELINSLNTLDLNKKQTLLSAIIKLNQKFEQEINKVTIDPIKKEKLAKKLAKIKTKLTNARKI